MPFLQRIKNLLATYRKHAIILCICIFIYIYYATIIKIRPFPDHGELSLSGCYVTNLYLISEDDSFILSLFYQSPAFVKIFDAKTKKCLYTSDLYSLEYLSPLIKNRNTICYGFLIIDTECKEKFVAPEEFRGF